jgi:nitrate/TMAO reductase-like tetraheme cytochrome c subunit
MKKVIILAVALSLILASVALATVLSSKHDMRLEDTVNASMATGVCEFCHHPHRGATASPDVSNALLWNKNYVSAIYTPYDSTATLTATPAAVTLDSSNMSTNSVYASALCMSCHDGANASNGIIKPVNGMGSSTAFTITYDNPASELASAMDQVFADDHPVNFTYVEDAGDDIPDMSTGGPTGSYLDGSISTNDYPLFNDTFQCSTCHNVHAGDNSASTALQFMRGEVIDSEICRDCHTAK